MIRRVWRAAMGTPGTVFLMVVGAFNAAFGPPDLLHTVSTTLCIVALGVSALGRRAS